MLEELQRRNFAATTIRTYLHGVAHFSRYCRRPPDQLGPEDIRKYQAMLFSKLKYSPNTAILRLPSLRFFYIHVLKRTSLQGNIATQRLPPSHNPPYFMQIDAFGGKWNRELNWLYQGNQFPVSQLFDSGE